MGREELVAHGHRLRGGQRGGGVRVEESRDHVYQAALLDPNTAATLTTTQAVAMCDELLAAHRDLLPSALRS